MKITVTVNHTTYKKGKAKAHLVQDEQGRQGWIMAKSLNENNEVNEATFEKAVENFVTPEQKEAERQAERDADNAMIDVADFIEGESASGKAVYMTAEWAEEHTDQAGEKRIYFPKSMVKNGALPQWMLNKKAAEIREDFHGGYFEISFAGQTFWK